MTNHTAYLPTEMVYASNEQVSCVNFNWLRLQSNPKDTTKLADQANSTTASFFGRKTVRLVPLDYTLLNLLLESVEQQSMFESLI